MEKKKTPEPPVRNWVYHELIFEAQRRFIEYGYRMTRLDDIGNAVEMPKGTIYCFVRSKEALFFLALVWAEAFWKAQPHPRRPVPAPPPEAIRAYALRRLRRALEPPNLNTDPPARPIEDARGELRDALAETYDRLFANRTALRLIQRCAREHPSLRDLRLRPQRKPTVERIRRFLETHREYLRKWDDPEILARMSYATIAYLAAYRRWHGAEIMIRKTRELREAVLNTLSQGVLRSTGQPLEENPRDEYDDDDDDAFDEPIERSFHPDDPDAADDADAAALDEARRLLRPCTHEDMKEM